MNTTSDVDYRDVEAGGDAALQLPLDKQQLVRRCMGNVQLAERLLGSFEGRFPVELAQIEQSAIEHDVVRTVRLVHQLKGAAANISAPILHHVMTRTEEAARAEAWDQVMQCLADARGEWDRFQQCLDSVGRSTQV